VCMYLRAGITKSSWAGQLGRTAGPDSWAGQLGRFEANVTKHASTIEAVDLGMWN
jgi:hypothetical protein